MTSWGCRLGTGRHELRFHEGSVYCLDRNLWVGDGRAENEAADAAEPLKPKVVGMRGPLFPPGGLVTRHASAEASRSSPTRFHDPNRWPIDAIHVGEHEKSSWQSKVSKLCLPPPGHRKHESVSNSHTACPNIPKANERQGMSEVSFAMGLTGSPCLNPTMSQPRSIAGNLC